MKAWSSGMTGISTMTVSRYAVLASIRRSVAARSEAESSPFTLKRISRSPASRRSASSVSSKPVPLV